MQSQSTLPPQPVLAEDKEINQTSTLQPPQSPVSDLSTPLADPVATTPTPNDESEDEGDSLLDLLAKQNLLSASGVPTSLAQGRPRTGSIASTLTSPLLNPNSQQPAPFSAEEDDYGSEEEEELQDADLGHDESGEYDLTATAPHPHSSHPHPHGHHHHHHHAHFQTQLVAGDESKEDYYNDEVEVEDGDEEEEQVEQQDSQMIMTNEDYYNRALNNLRLAGYQVQSFFYSRFYRLINEVHYANAVPMNRFLNLICGISDLAVASERSGASDIVINFIRNALTLALDLGSQHVNAKEQRLDESYLHKYEYRMGALDETVNVVNLFMADVTNSASITKLGESITNLLNHFDNPSDRFFREHPYLCGLVGAGLMLLGAGLLALGALLMPGGSPVAAVPLTCGAILCSFGLSLMITPAIVRLTKSKDERVLIAESDATAKDARALLASPATLFNPNKAKGTYVINTSLENTVIVNEDSPSHSARF